MKISDFHENYRIGYRLIYGAMRYHPLVGWKKPYDRGQAWMWLIIEACGKENGREILRDFGGKKRMIQEKYGQTSHSIRFMAEAWGWSKQKVITFLQHLSNTNPPMIVQNVVQQISQITVCNFVDYQKPKSSKKDSNRTAIGQQKDSNRTNYNSKERKYVSIKEKDMFRTTDIVQEPLNGNLKKFSDYDWSKDVVEIVRKYATLNLVIDDNTKNVEFWDGHIDIMSDYFPSDGEMKRWFNSRMFEINTWQRDNPHRASKSSKGLRQRISRWLAKEYQKLEVTKR